MNTVLRWAVFGLGSAVVANLLFWTLIAPGLVERMVR